MNIQEYKPLTPESLKELFDSLKSVSIVQREPVMYLGEFGLKYLDAVVNNNEVEMSKLDDEMLISNLKERIRLSKKHNVELDVMYLVDSCFSKVFSISSDKWTVISKDFNDDEYDNSYEKTILYHSGEYWIIEEIWSDGYYDTKILNKYAIDDIKLFDLILKYGKF